MEIRNVKTQCMTILAIGKNAFLASAIINDPDKDHWHFMDHQSAMSGEAWSQDIETVVNFAYDPVIQKGEFSELDRLLAKKAQEVEAQYIMLSSRAVYGVPPKPFELIESANPYKKMTPYGHAKRLIEDDLMERFDHVTILRLSNIFGDEYQAHRERQTFFGTMLKSLKEEGGINFSMSALTQRDFLPLDNFSQWLGIIANNPVPGVFNLGAGFGTACGDIAYWLMEGYGDGRLNNTEDDVIDSFVLDMAKTRGTYTLPPIYMREIRESCMAIGRRLKEL